MWTNWYWAVHAPDSLRTLARGWFAMARCMSGVEQLKEEKNMLAGIASHKSG